ncbi:MAG TPA: phosphotransferase [Candidatus Dormibacteraeota bacterium]
MRRVREASSVGEMLVDATDRHVWKTSDSLSGSRLERVTIAGERCVVKYTSVDDDWIMRATGDLHCRQLTLFRSGVLDPLPGAIDHCIVACAPYTSERGHRGGAFLMRDVSADLVPAGTGPIPLEQHTRFLEHMALMHATFAGFEVVEEFFPVAHHFVMLTPAMAAIEAERGGRDPVPPAVANGWQVMAKRHPRQSEILLDLARDPSPLVDALSVGPATLLHGDWKLGNLGSSGVTTLLLDWDRCGAGAPLVDVAWYLAVNCDRLPESKEDTLATYRRALEAAGVDTSSWWTAQLRPALAGAFVQLGWSKNDDEAEFGWWSDRLDEALQII